MAQIADVTFYANLNALGIVSIVISAPDTDPRNALVPKAPVPTPIPTVTVYANPSESPSPSASASVKKKSGA